MPHWKHAISKGTTLAVVTLLHLLVFVYLTMPPIPSYSRNSARTLSPTRALQLVFMKQPTPSTISSPSPVDAAPVHAQPRSSRTARSTRASIPEPLETQRPAKIIPMRDEDNQGNASVTQEVISVDAPYGNPMLKQSQRGLQPQEHPAIPGYADRELVKTISVGEQLSPRQILQEDGRFLNCSQVRMARFLSASEMDKRRITTQQLDQAFTEFGCT